MSGSEDAPTSGGAVPGQPPPARDVLHLRGLTKKFAGIAALDSVDLRVRAGQVHALLGHNGSGKSTLIKTLAGYHAPEPGSVMEFDGKPVELPLAPGRFRELGIAFVHQDLALVPSLTVFENMRILDWSARGGRVRWKDEHDRVRADLAALGVDVDPDATVAALSQGERALVAVARAASDLGLTDAGGGRHRSGLLVLDEPTVFLSEAGRERLFALVHRVAALGAGVLFVSHDLDEVLENTDVVTVLRDGKVVGSKATSATTHDELVQLIIGRAELPTVARASRSGTNSVVARVESVSGGAAPLEDVSFEIRSGEILGVTGLLGSGFNELPYLLFGGASADVEGRVVIDGKTLPLAGVQPAKAIDFGLALIPSNRPRDGGILTLPVADNIMMLSLDKCRTGMRLSTRRIMEAAAVQTETFDVRPRDARAQYGRLSGGNQQKALVAKWLLREPRLLLLDEPTQGVDVGARHQIVEQLRKLCKAGGAVMYCSADHAELAEVCHRVLIFRRGRLVRTLVGDEVDKELITRECIGVADRRPHGE
ncbi:sugar ABC transporter ATP-binding protein [Actinacidiphila oryziradicis]|uniref:sugar ABC transporter ATP-binding protein n=1 Tax=Actinacidiphila oryziradicis TaxID=2571141 RepID=UPI0023F243C6|nr:sugar ABC transporter ATP-binding protein [Actinacidiphila oryziradicis]MCW2868699.1 Monosaccharide-transporting ATPase [Actinacidiphila oryziradicis]